VIVAGILMLKTVLLLSLAGGLYVTGDMTYTMAMTENEGHFGGYLGFLGPVVCVLCAFALGYAFPRTASLECDSGVAND
jgi:hypothetical protein